MSPERQRHPERMRRGKDLRRQVLRAAFLGVLSIMSGSCESSNPDMGLSTEQLTFNNDSLTGSLTVRNQGKSSLLWNVFEDVPWIIAISPADGLLDAGQSQDVEVSVDPSGMGSGSYDGEIVFYGNGRTPQTTVTTHLDVETSIVVTEPHVGENLLVGTAKTIAWSAEFAGASVQIDLFRGLLHQCAISPSTANSGAYDWIVDDCGNGTGSDYRVRVTSLADSSIWSDGAAFTIQAVAPTLCTSTTSITLTDPTPTASFDVWNCGTGTLSWSAGESCSWLGVDIASGTSAGEHDTVSLTVDWTAFSPGETKLCDVAVTSNGGSSTVSVTATSPAAPTLCTSTTSVSLTDPTPTATVDLWNCGTGSLTWSVTESCAWLDGAPASGSSTGEHDTVTLTVDWTAFSPGETKLCDVAVTSNGGSATVSVSATSPAVPTLCTSTTSVTLTDPTPSATFDVWNCGTGTLNWSVDESCSWLSRSPDSGTSAGEHDTLTLTVAWAAFAPGETKICDVAVTSNGGSATVSVTATSPDLSTLCTSTTSITLTDPTPTATFDLWNCGTGTLNWSVNESCSWLGSAPASGTSTGEHDTVSLTVDWGAFAPGETKICDVAVISNGGSSTVSVTATSPAVPTLCTSTTSVTITEPTPTATFDIWNCGTGAMNWSVSEGCSWLSRSPASGTSTGEHDTVTLTVDWGAFAPGETKLCNVAVNSDGGSATVVLTATRPAVPTLCTSTTSITLTDPTPTATFEIWNCGTGAMSWSVSESCPWLSRSPGSGTSSGEHDTVTLTVNWTTFAPGETRLCNISVTSTGGSSTVVLTATRPAVPTLCTSTTSVTLTDPTPSATFDVWNCGTGTLNWSVGESCSWLGSAPASGTSSGEHDTVSLTVDWTAFAPGETKLCDVAVISNGGSSTVSVTATSPAAPTLCTSTTSVTLTDPTPSATFDIWNCGTGSLTWSVSESCAWLDGAPASGSSTGEHDTVTLTVDWTAFASGETKLCDVAVVSNGGSSTVSVTATSPAVPTLCTSTSSITLTDPTPSATFDIWNCGTGTLNWSVDESCSWLGSEPASGTSAGEHDAVTLTVAWAAFAPGETKICDVAVTSDGGSATVSVTATSPDQSTLCTSTTSVTLTDPTPTATFDLWNCGTGTLNWSVDESCPWLGSEPASGTSTGEHDTVTLTVDWTAFAPGETKLCDVAVTSDGGSSTVSVTATSPAVPTLCTSTTSVTLNYPTSTAPIDIWNCGTGSLTWSVDESCSWLDGAPASGMSTGENDTVTLTVDWTEFSPGETKTCDVSVTSDGGSATITVRAERDVQVSFTLTFYDDSITQTGNYPYALTVTSRRVDFDEPSWSDCSMLGGSVLAKLKPRTDMDAYLQITRSGFGSLDVGTATSVVWSFPADFEAGSAATQPVDVDLGACGPQAINGTTSCDLHEGSFSGCWSGSDAGVFEIRAVGGEDDDGPVAGGDPEAAIASLHVEFPGWYLPPAAQSSEPVKRIELTQESPPLR